MTYVATVHMTMTESISLMAGGRAMLTTTMLVRTGRSSILAPAVFGLKATNGEEREQMREVLPKNLIRSLR